MSAIRVENNVCYFDYANRTYRVWRHRTGRIVYKWDSSYATYPRNVDSAVRPGSEFCRLLQACAEQIECAGCSV